MTVDNKDSFDSFNYKSSDPVLEDKTYVKDTSLGTIYSGKNLSVNNQTQPKIFSYMYIPPEHSYVNGYTTPRILGDSNQIEFEDYNITSGAGSGKKVADDNEVSVASSYAHTNDNDEKTFYATNKDKLPESYMKMLERIGRDFSDMLDKDRSALDMEVFSGAKKPVSSNRTVSTPASKDLLQPHYGDTSMMEYSSPNNFTDNELHLTDSINGRRVYNTKLYNMSKSIASYMIDHFGKDPEVKPDLFFNAVDKLNIKNLMVGEMQELFTVTSSMYRKMISTSISAEVNPLYTMDYSLLTQLDRIKLNAMEETIFGSGYLEFVEYSKIQSLEYNGFHSLRNFTINRNTMSNIHPLIFALFAQKLPLIEDSCINGDSYMFLRQKLHRSNMLRSDNYDLYLNKLSDRFPMRVIGSDNILDSEIRFIHMHAMLRRVVTGMRRGEFNNKYSDRFISWLKRCMPTNFTSLITEDELLISAFFGLFGIKPTMIIYPKVINNLVMSDVRVVPMIHTHVSPSSLTGISNLHITGLRDSPIASINNASFDSLNYNPTSNKIIFQQIGRDTHQMTDSPMRLGISAMEPSLIDSIKNSNVFGLQNKVIISNGIVVYFVQRRVSSIESKLGSDKFGTFRSFINNKPLNFDDSLLLNNETYKLSSVLCHRVLSQKSINLNPNIEESLGYTAFVRKSEDKSDAFIELPQDGTDIDISKIESVFDKYDKNSNIKNKSLNDGNEWAYFDQFGTQSSKTNAAADTDDNINIMDYLKCPTDILSYMSSKCCLLVYAKDYKTYAESKLSYTLGLY